MLFRSRLFIDEFKEALVNIKKEDGYKSLQKNIVKTVTMATGKLTFSIIQKFTSEIMDLFPGISIRVICIRNDFFGETITVSGLITGQDLINQIREVKDKGEILGDILYIPSNMLRMGEQVFLDDVTVNDVESALGMRLVAIESGGKEFIDAILSKDYKMDRNNENFVYVQAFKPKNDK